MRILYEHETTEFDHVRSAIVRFFGSDHVVTIHDGDGATLLDCLRGNYCAGTVASPAGVIVASFAIDYLMSGTEEEPSHREVVAVHIGPPGYWCRSEADCDRYNRWVADLTRQYEADKDSIS